MNRVRFLAASLAMAAAVGSCATHGRPDPLTPQEEFGLLPLTIEDGVTTKEAALLHYGLPSAQFEGERILTWRLMRSKGKVVSVSREFAPEDPRVKLWQHTSFNLVLVFDEHHVVARHSLLEVR
jgi:hypothetical protein